MMSRPTRTMSLGVLVVASLLAACSANDPQDVASGVNPQANSANAGRTIVVSDQPVVGGSFVTPFVEIYGQVEIGSQSFVAGNAVLRADRDGWVCLGNKTNVQDNVRLMALRGQETASEGGDCGKLSANGGNETTFAHQASVTNSTVGNFVFVGFRAVITDSVVRDGAFILHGAVVDGVTIAADRIVGIGQKVTTQQQADALPKLTEANVKFKREVLEVNKEFAKGYTEAYQSGGVDVVTGVSANPATKVNPKPVKPTIGTGCLLDSFVRIVGDVRLGAGSSVGRRTSIRADEGSPIVIGAGAQIKDRVSFHALAHENIMIGSALRTQSNVVFHGPLTVGDRLSISDDVVLFRSKVGNNVSIGQGAIVVDVTLANGTVVPAGAVITKQAQADALVRHT